MADFAEWVVACEPALPWSRGTFIAAYDRNRDAIVEATIEADIVAAAIRGFVTTRHRWEGTATELLAMLNNATNEATRKLKNWPATATALSGRLRRTAPNLRKMGIGVDFDRETGRSRNRKILLSTGSTEFAAEGPSTSSIATALPKPLRAITGLPSAGLADARPAPGVLHKPLTRNGLDASDGSDEKIPVFSGGIPDAAADPAIGGDK
jgi:hypothetical protein